MGQKIAMIGAGSVVFCKTLIHDILATPSLDLPWPGVTG